MRHNKKFNHLGRKSAHRKSMLSNMASSLIENKRISTTLAKAKALRTYVEPIITKAKNDTTHSRRVVFSHLQNKDAVSELFRDIAVKVGDRPGGYTRILRTGNRIGDNAEMCIIELVDYNETMLASQAEGEKPKRKRSRRGTGKKVQSPAAEVKQKDVKKTASAKEAKAAPAASEDILTVEDKKDDTPVADVADVADNSDSQIENSEKDDDNPSVEKQD